MSDPFDLAALSTIHNVCHVLNHIKEKGSRRGENECYPPLH